MTKKNWYLLTTLLVLGTVYVFFFTDWFRPKIITIFHTSRINRLAMNPRRAGAKPATIPVMFGLNYRYKLTELKVLPLAVWQTNHAAVPIWHLISTSNSVPIKQFYYGQTIKGMHPSVPGTHAEPLEPDVTYHMTLTAGSARGEHDFEAKPAN
jgi:hypothetical protein